MLVLVIVKELQIFRAVIWFSFCVGRIIGSSSDALAWCIFYYKFVQFVSIYFTKYLEVNPKYLRFVHRAQYLLYLFNTYIFPVVRFHKNPLAMMR